MSLWCPYVSAHTYVRDYLSFPCSSVSKYNCWQNVTDWKSSRMLCSLIPTELKPTLENPLHSIQLMCLGADLEGTPVGWERSLNPNCFEIKEDLRVALMDLNQSWDWQRETVTTAGSCCRVLRRWSQILEVGLGHSCQASPGLQKAGYERRKMRSWQK